MTSFRDYQLRAMGEVADHWDRGTTSVCLVAPTGAGKTVMGLGLVRWALRRRRRVLWLAHTTELVAQSAGVLRDAGLEVGIIQAGLPADPLAPVQVASIQTLAARGFDRLPDADMVVLDECHHYRAAEWGQVADFYRHAHRVGLTATPERSDGRPLGDLFDALVVAAHYQELLSDGHLVPCRVFRATELGGDLAMDPLAAYQRHTPGEQGFLYAPSVAQAEKWAEQFTDGGVPTEVIEANTPKLERAERLARFRAGDLRMLANVYALTEGVDVPQASVCLLARGCGHVSPYLQMVGRVLRPAPGKQRATLIDLPGVSHGYGLPLENRCYSLDGSGIARDPSAAALRLCIRCGMTVTSSPCKYCGADLTAARPTKTPRIFSFELREVYAADSTPPHAKNAEWSRLVGVASERGFSLGWAVKQYRTLFGAGPPELLSVGADVRRTEFDRLSKRAEEHGYQAGWIAHQFKALFGVWPPRDWTRRADGGNPPLPGPAP